MPVFSFPENVIIHPLVLLSTVDHFNRAARGKGRVVGVLLGETRTGQVHVTNSFAGQSMPPHSSSFAPRPPARDARRQRDARADNGRARPPVGGAERPAASGARPPRCLARAGQPPAPCARWAGC